MRKEADNVGPNAELEHWKKRLARFDSLNACVKSQDCKTVVSILVATKSKVLKVCAACTHTCMLLLHTWEIVSNCL